MVIETLFDEAFSENTRRAYRADWNVFASWCLENNLTACPSDPETVAKFIVGKAELRAPATIRRYVAAIATVHKLSGEADPTKARQVVVAIKRMHRKSGKRQRQAYGMTADLRNLLIESYVKRDSIVAKRNRALIAVSYDTGRRRSEVVSLRVEDMDYAEDGSATILVRRSKTDQEGDGLVCYLAPDSVDLIEAWLDAAGIFEGPIFRSLRRGGVVRGQLPPAEVSRIFKESAAQAGLPFEVVEKISGHSTRVGMAQDMLANNFDIASIMHAGGWKSPAMVVRYGERLAAKKGASARLAEIQGRNKLRSAAQEGTP